MFVRLVAVSAAAVLFATAADAQVSVFTGSSQATACSRAAKHPGPNIEAIPTCTVAIEHEALFGRELAGTFVNRGVLYLRNGDFDRARADFDTALSIDPRMGEALINRGAAEIAERRFAAGVADIDRGLTLNPEEPEKAYYNRALAKERLDDLKGAYFDYMKAAELAPTWLAPRNELRRFNVESRRPG